MLLLKEFVHTTLLHGKCIILKLGTINCTENEWVNIAVTLLTFKICLKRRLTKMPNT